MDSSVIRDISDDETPAAAPVDGPARSEAIAHERTRRRFSFDPAISPVMAAALAWDPAVSR